MLPTSELTSIRTAANQTLDTSCIIKRRTGTPDGYMGETDTWSVVTTVHVGLTEPTGGQLQNYAYVIGNLATWQVRFPYGTDVRIHDYLYIGTDVIQVQVVLTPRSYASLIVALASEIK